MTLINATYEDKVKALLSFRVKRSTSNAANNNNPLAGTGMKIVSGAPGAGGGGGGPRKKIPASLTSSLNRDAIQ